MTERLEALTSAEVRMYWALVHLSHDQQRVTLREVAALSGTAVGHVHQTMKKLVRLGLVQRYARGYHRPTYELIAEGCHVD